MCIAKCSARIQDPHLLKRRLREFGFRHPLSIAHRHASRLTGSQHELAPLDPVGQDSAPLRASSRSLGKPQHPCLDRRHTLHVCMPPMPTSARHLPIGGGDALFEVFPAVCQPSRRRRSPGVGASPCSFGTQRSSNAMLYPMHDRTRRRAEKTRACVPGRRGI